MKRIISLGQCSADHASIEQFLKRHFQLEVEPADSAARLHARLKESVCDLILVNRLLDVDGSSGLDVIRELKDDRELARIPVMLVSNFADAQRQAVAAGALEGFGKAQLHGDDLVDRLRPLLE